MARTHAYCFASGLIKFGQSVPKGALVIAHGRDDIVRGLIDATARHGYKTRKVRGRLTKIPGTDCLLVPGVPEAPSQDEAYTALRRYATWIKGHRRGGIAVVVGGP